MYFYLLGIEVHKKNNNEKVRRPYRVPVFKEILKLCFYAALSFVYV